MQPQPRTQFSFFFHRFLFEYSAPNLEIYEKWVSGIKNVIGGLTHEIGFSLDHRKVTFTNRTVLNLENAEEKAKFVEVGPCSCGNPVTFFCGCQIQGYCSTNCEAAHFRYHSPTCIKDQIPPKVM